MSGILGLQSGVSDGVDNLIGDAKSALQSLANQSPGLDPGEIQAIKDQIITLQATVASQGDDHERTIALSLQALTQLHKDKDLQRINILYILGNTNYILGDLSEAENYYRQVRAIAEKIGFFIRYILSTYRLARIQHMRGDLHLAFNLYRECLREAIEQQHERDLGIGFIYSGSGEILYEWNRLEEAKQMILEAVRVDERTMVPPILANSYNIYARLLIGQGDLDAARAVLLKAKDLLAKYPMAPEVIEVNEACWLRLWMAVGDLSTANKWARGRRTPPDDSRWFSRMPGEIANARLMIAGSQYQQAGERLEQLAGEAESGGWFDHLIKIRILQALVNHAGGLNDEALDYLGESLRLAEPHGYVSVYVDEGKPAEILLKEGLLQERWAAPEIKRYVDNLLRAFNHDRSKQYNN